MNIIIVKKKILFKIDLIVWKYISNNRIGPNSMMFKIDLIVWKLVYRQSVSNKEDKV